MVDPKGYLQKSIALQTFLEDEGDQSDDIGDMYKFQASLASNEEIPLMKDIESLSFPYLRILDLTHNYI